MPQHKRAGAEAQRHQHIVATLALAAGGVASAAVVAHHSGGFGFLRGWLQDRAEEEKMAVMMPGMRERLRRMRRWRQSLAPADLERWVAVGSAGADLRDFRGRKGYCRELEAALAACHPEGPTVHQHEMVWVMSANRRWLLVEALLDSGNNSGLVIPGQLAHLLGYSNQDGVPHRGFALGTQQAHTGNGIATLFRIPNVTFSVAGREMAVVTLVRPTRTSTGHPYVLVVPAQTIRVLNTGGIRFSML